MEGLGADSEENREPVSDINTAVVDSLKVLDPKRPIREADIGRQLFDVRFVPIASIRAATPLFDHLVGAGEQRCRLGERERS